MIFISDIHHGLSGLEELPKDKGPLVILGDLINWIDYRNGEGIAKDVFGEDNINMLIAYRKNHDYKKRKQLWQKIFEKDPEQKQRLIEEAIASQYNDVFNALQDHEVWIIPGNVDSVPIMEDLAGSNIRFVDSEVINYKDINFGFAGGGVPTPINARGELSEEDFNKKLKKLKGVDVICTHAPPLINELATDVITNQIEQGWSSLVDYIRLNQPRFSIFGDVHQPKATRWKIYDTYCINIGYNRETKDYLYFEELSYP